VFTTESDIPGLVVEAGTFEELVDLVRSLAPEVIAANMPAALAPYTRTRHCVNRLDQSRWGQR